MTPSGVYEPQSMLTSASSSARYRGRRASTASAGWAWAGMAREYTAGHADEAASGRAESSCSSSACWTAPNRFFTRPAVKLEFGADEPGAAAEVAVAAGESVRHLYAGLELQPAAAHDPRLA